MQQPGPPIWLGGTHPDAIRRAAAIADGWMGAGGGSFEAFRRDIALMKEELDAPAAIRQAIRCRSAFSSPCTNAPMWHALNSSTAGS